MIQSIVQDVQERSNASPRTTNQGAAFDREESESECKLSISSSMQDAAQTMRNRPSSPDSHPSVLVQGAANTNRKELDEIKGIPAYPTTPEFAGWKREVRYAVEAASANPEAALNHVLEAETWRGEIFDMPRNMQFDTLEVKFGKALRHVLRGDVKREVANLEERVLREKRRLLRGSEIYAWVIKQFNRDLKLARPQVLEELSLVKLGQGKDALRSFKTRWDATVERLAGLGSCKESDEEILYIYFKKQFMRSEDMADSVAKVRRSPPQSEVHSYEWMYRAVQNRLETMRLETQELERVAGYRLDTPHPITPGLTVKGQTPKRANVPTKVNVGSCMIPQA